MSTDICQADTITAGDMVQAKEIADTLQKHYPGHLWAVHVEQGLAKIHNLQLSGQWGFILKLPQMYSASELQKNVIRAGGELLERYKMSRGRFQAKEYDALPLDVAGRPKGDLS